MAELPLATAQSSWRGDPERDFVTYRLIEVAHDALDEYFSDDDHLADYEKRMRGKRGKKNAASAKPQVLEHWLAGDDNVLELIAQPEKQHFGIRFEAENFKAEVAAAYGPDLGGLLAAWVVNFEGDAAAFLSMAVSFKDQLTDEMSDLDLDDIGLEMFLKAENQSQFPVRHPNDAAGSTDVTEQDIKQVKQLAKSLAANLKRGEFTMPEPHGQAYLEAKPQCLWPILGGFLSACQPVIVERQDENLKAAYQILLAHQLELIRYKSEEGWAWADEMIADYQQRVMEIAKAGQLSAENLLALAAALTEAKIPLNPAAAEAFLQGAAKPLDPESSHALPSAEVIRSDIQPLITTLGEGTDNPFWIVEGLKDTIKLMPPGMHAFLVHEFALSSHVVLRDAVPLMLLDPEAEVRQAAGAALEQIAAPNTLSPVALRRAIILRNWIPEDERAGVDRAITKARTKGVACAQWIVPPQLSILGMPIDGSGAHGLIVTTQAGKTGLFGGILCKQTFGLRDVWCDAEKPRREINQALAGSRRETAAIEVVRDYLDVMLQHYLGVGLSQGRLPTPDLLAIAEAVGAAGWRAARLEIDAEINRLLSGLSPEDISPEAISASLKRSGQWLTTERFADSWFEGDAEVASVIMRSSKRKGDAVLKAIFESVLEKRRGLWAEKFFLMSLWARAAKVQKDGKYWRDFFILARELSAGRKLNEIPIMTAIAQRTIAVTRSAAPF